MLAFVSVVDSGSISAAAEQLAGPGAQQLGFALLQMVRRLFQRLQVNTAALGRRAGMHRRRLPRLLRRADDEAAPDREVFPREALR